MVEVNSFTDNETKLSLTAFTKCFPIVFPAANALCEMRSIGDVLLKHMHDTVIKIILEHNSTKKFYVHGFPTATLSVLLPFWGLRHEQ